MADSGFSLNTKEIESLFPQFIKESELTILAYCEQEAKRLESEAKKNRPWRDHTTRARNGLTGVAEKTSKGFEIALAHTVDYGISLEMEHEKRYAILEPTVRLESPKIIQGMTNLLERLGSGK